jgi:DNA-binding transcriptional ArsR family regulator
VAEPFAEVERFLRALANDNRLRLLTRVFSDGREHTVGEVALAIGLANSTVSEHLKQLREAGVLVSRRDGKEVWYRADRDAILAQLDRLRALLGDCC